MTQLNIISLGAGVQSTTMALMAAHGEITPMPDCAIFADTQSEPVAVYDHLKWLMSPNVLPFPVHIVTAGDLKSHIGWKPPNGKHNRIDIPAFVQATDGSVGLMSRQCTRDFKISPIRRKVRQLAGIDGKRSPKKQVVSQWIGISLDEAIRMRPSQEVWQQMRWPLIEKRMSRGDCLEWMKRKGYPHPPKSSCTFCPYHSLAQWRALTPPEFAEAVEIDKRLRSKQYRATGTLYLHSSCKPLDQVDLSTAEDRGQLNLFNNDCEGMCGV